MNSAFVGYEELSRPRRVLSNEAELLYYSFKIIPSLNRFTCIDVKFIFDSARLGLSSSANILQIADVTLRVVFLLFLPIFLTYYLA